jgi:peptidoglycan/LPS O-acetylase OafA/YrhL
MSARNNAAQPPRLTFLDTLRALAALAVLLAHMLSELSPGFQRFRFGLFDPGSFGVTIFFICSGFIIQPSIERSPSLGSFWRRRFYRLFPLYWCSVLITAAVITLGLARPSELLADATPSTLLANLTMLQSLFGAPHLQIVYWSLTFELIFYLVVTLFVAARIGRYSAVITAGLIGMTLIVEVLSPLLGGPRVPLNMCGFLVIMFSGVLFQRVSQGQVGVRAALGLTLAGLAVNIAAALVDSLVRSGGLWQNLYLVTAWAGAHAVFVGAYFLRGSPALALPSLLFVGRVSYSLYLLHLPIILVIPALGGPLTSVAIWSATSLGAAALGFSLIEAPMIARSRTREWVAGQRAA